MDLVIDTSVVIAVITNETHKRQLVELSRGASLLAPPSVHCEVGNAFSAMLKRRRIPLKQALVALASYRRIPIRFSEVDLDTALELASELNIYAYDAYVIGCALKHRAPLVTLDEELGEAAVRAGAAVREV